MTRAYKLYALGTHLVFTLRRGGDFTLLCCIWKDSVKLKEPQSDFHPAWTRDVILEKGFKTSQ